VETFDFLEEKTLIETHKNIILKNKAKTNRSNEKYMLL